MHEPRHTKHWCGRRRIRQTCVAGRPALPAMLALALFLLPMSVTTPAGVIADPNFRVPSTIAGFVDALYAVNARFDVAPPDAPASDVEFEVVRTAKRSVAR